jgi:hypothetical protein
MVLAMLENDMLVRIDILAFNDMSHLSRNLDWAHKGRFLCRLIVVTLKGNNVHLHADPGGYGNQISFIVHRTHASRPGQSAKLTGESSRVR